MKRVSKILRPDRESLTLENLLALDLAPSDYEKLREDARKIGTAWFMEPYMRAFVFLVCWVWWCESCKETSRIDVAIEIAIAEHVHALVQARTKNTWRFGLLLASACAWALLTMLLGDLYKAIALACVLVYYLGGSIWLIVWWHGVLRRHDFGRYPWLILHPWGPHGTRDRAR